MAPDPELTRILSFDKVDNFRDMGGYSGAAGGTVRWRRLFRSGHLGAASTADQARLASLGVGLVVDFRDDSELEDDGSDRVPPGTTVARHPQLDPNQVGPTLRAKDPELLRSRFAKGQAAAIMADQMRIRIVKAAPELGSMVRSILANEQPGSLVHCTAGKDRAGLGAAVILLTLGVSEEQVLEDYLLSNEARREVTAERIKVATDDETREILLSFLLVRPEYLTPALARAGEQFGTWENYARQAMGLHPAEVSEFRDRYLE